MKTLKERAQDRLGVKRPAARFAVVPSLFTGRSRGFCASATLILLLSGIGIYAQQPEAHPGVEKRDLACAPVPDWPQLKRFQADNAALNPPGPGEKRVVFLGSSTTDNWGRKFGSVFFPGKPYLNRGISGQTTPQMLVRFQQDVVELRPAVVVILGGSNDVAGMTGPATLEMIENNLRSMVAIARTNGIKVILASQLPTLDFPWDKGKQPAPTLLALSAWEREYAHKEGLGFVDYYSVLAGADGGPKEGLSVDGLHPSAQGYALMAPVVENAIAKAMSGN